MSEPAPPPPPELRKWNDYDSSTSSWRGNTRVHVCNCIGCCEHCGMCRTNPKHNLKVCDKVASLRREIKEVIENA